MAEEVYIGHLARLVEQFWALGHRHKHPEDAMASVLHLIANDDNHNSIKAALDRADGVFPGDK